MGRPRVISYGEDPLTYWALTTRLESVLDQLGDDTPPDNCLVVYRPSFGRGGGAQFGEFDAIIKSSRAVYLVEAKWHRSPEVSGVVVGLRPVQVLRHQILRWYLEAWATSTPGHWADFERGHAEAFAASFPGQRLAPVGSELANNLEFLLRGLSTPVLPIADVVLFVGLAGTPLPTGVSSEKFALVALSYEGIDRTGYFEVASKR